MLRRLRTFIAVEISAEIQAAAQKLVCKLAAVDADVKWVEPSNYHFTMKFLGDVPMDEIYEVCAAVERATAQNPAFELSVYGVGAFPEVERPRTLWVGVDLGAEEMVQLAESIESELHELGYPRERRRFRPHLSLGRVRRQTPQIAALSREIAACAEVDLGALFVDAATVFTSKLGREGPKYEAIGHGELA